MEAASPVFEAWVDEEKDEAPNRSDCPLQRVEVFYSYFSNFFSLLLGTAAGSWKLLRIIQKFKKFKGLY